MSSFFANLKKSVGLSSSSIPSNSKGHKLGSSGNEATTQSSTQAAVDRTNSSTNNYNHTSSHPLNIPTRKVLDVTYGKEDKSLGIEISVYLDNTSGINYPMVSRVISQSPSDRKGVIANDVIIGIDGNVILSYDVFVELIQSLERPVVLSFSRDIRNDSKKSSSSLSELEKDARRQAMINAAQERSQAWDKKISAGKAMRLNAASANNAFEFDVKDEDMNPETIKRIELAKQHEKLMAAKLGYDLYKPVLSSSASASSANNLAATTTNNTQTPTSTSSSSSPRNNTGTSTSTATSSSSSSSSSFRVDEEVVGAVDDCLASLLSYAGSEEELGDPTATAEGALMTVFKMLSNLFNHKDEDKFRTIRLGNPAFNKKVVSVPGALDLMLVAGFAMHTEETSTGTGARTVGDDTFLKHSMDIASEYRLRYVISRLQEILEGDGGAAV